VSYSVKTMDHQAADALGQDRDAPGYGSIAQSRMRQEWVFDTLGQANQPEGTYEHLMSTVGNPDGPQITNISATPASTTVTVTWTTSEPGDTRLVWGTAPNQFDSGTSWKSDHTTDHSDTATGLTPATLYYFEVRSRDSAGNLMGGQVTATTL
jgi:hypothetical protein